MNVVNLSKSVQKVALEAGKYIGEERKKFQSNRIEHKDVNNLVSYVDKEAEIRIVDGLRKILPEAGFITEEGTTMTGDKNALNWIIDPLDGTANFIHNVPHYSVSIALSHGKDVEIGVIYDICKNDMYSAVKGQGAFLNDTPIHVSANNKLSQSLVSSGFPYNMADKTEDYLKILQHFLKTTHGFRRFGSAALDLAFVAKGVYDGFYEFNLHSWDMAAGVLLVSEAGGKVTDFKGGDDFLFGGDIIAASAAHGEIMNVIQKYWRF
ncbi:MAG: inositol monophosphatase family protein [Leadbetterella sp.]